MKCQKCGMNEAIFHYSSNINGCVTQESLCLECAKKEGYDFDHAFSFDHGFGGIDSILNGFGGFMPSGIPVRRAYTAYPIIMQGIPFTTQQSNACSCGAAQCAPEATDAQVDSEMTKRREINAVREQMRMAAEGDDFEKAIELREKIKEMEKTTEG